MKKLLLLLLLSPIPCFADRLGSLNSNAQVMLSTQGIQNTNSLQSGSSFYVTHGVIEGDASASSDGLFVTKTNTNGYSWWMQHTGAANATNYLSWAWILNGAFGYEIMGEQRITSNNIGAGSSASKWDLFVKKAGSSFNMITANGNLNKILFESPLEINSSSMTVNGAARIGGNLDVTNSGAVTSSSGTFTRITGSTVTTRSIVFRDPDNSHSQNWILFNQTANSTATWALNGGVAGEALYLSAGSNNPTISHKYVGNLYLHTGNNVTDDGTEYTGTGQGPGSSWETGPCITYTESAVATGRKLIEMTGSMSTSSSNDRVYANIMVNGSVAIPDSYKAVCGDDDGASAFMDCPFSVRDAANLSNGDVVCVAYGNDNGTTQTYINRSIGGVPGHTEITITETTE